MLNALRFGAKCNAFWCKTSCVLMLIALRFGAKCVAKTSLSARIFCYCGCKFGIIFLQREMQKHSKWQKVEEKSTRCCPPFPSFECILYQFSTPVRDKDLPRIVPIAYSFQYALAVPRAYSRRNSMQPMPHRDS